MPATATGVDAGPLARGDTIPFAPKESTSCTVHGRNTNRTGLLPHKDREEEFFSEYLIFQGIPKHSM